MSLPCLKSLDDFLNALGMIRPCVGWSLPIPFLILRHSQLLCGTTATAILCWFLQSPGSHFTGHSYVWTLIFPSPFISWPYHIVRIPVTVLQYLLLFPVDFFTFTDECNSPSKIMSYDGRDTDILLTFAQHHIPYHHICIQCSRHGLDLRETHHFVLEARILWVMGESKNIFVSFQLSRKCPWNE